MKWPWKRKKLVEFEDFDIDYNHVAIAPGDYLSVLPEEWSYNTYRRAAGLLPHKHFYRFIGYNWYFKSRFLLFECEICHYRYPEMRESVFWDGYWQPPKKEDYEAARAKTASDRGGEKPW